MEIQFSKHSLDQLRIRFQISKHMILMTLENPESVTDTYRGRELYRRRFRGRLLEVVVIKEDNKVVVITQYFLEN